MKKYNEYTSTCNVCGVKGWHEKPTKCTREKFPTCKHCGQSIDGKPVQCKGTNVLIDYTNISKQFIPYYANGQRIKVKNEYGEVKSGTVGMTTRWKPVFLLMLRSNSTGSSYILTDKEKIL